MATFNANVTPISDIILSQVVGVYADVAAADSSGVGTFYVVFVVEKQNADGSWSNFTESGLISSALTLLSQNFSYSYTPPSIGQYRFSISVRNMAYAWQTVSQSKQAFGVSPIPVVNGFAYYVPISKPPAALNIRKLIRQPAGHYLPEDGLWQQIDGQSIVDNSVLDLTKWRRKYWSFYEAHADHLVDEIERYVDSAVDYQNGALLLTATPQAGTTGHAPSPSGIQYPLFNSGMVRSVKSATYFFAHLQLILPKQLGIRPAWWMIPEDGSIDPNPEIDMIDVSFNGANETYNMMHTNCSQNKVLLWRDASFHPDYNYIKPNPAFYAADYWVNRVLDVCIDWRDDDTVTTYLDGNPVAKWYFPWTYRNNQAVPATQMIDYGIGDSWATANFTTAVPTVPTTLQVNFLKTFSKVHTIYGADSPV